MLPRKIRMALHAKLCGLEGTALPIPVRDYWSLFQIQTTVIHPETLAPIVEAGEVVSGLELNRIADYFGVDYVMI